MYVCVCHGVSESQVRRAADEGCRDVHELTMRLGLGSSCGSCLPLAAEILTGQAAMRVLELPILRAA